MDFGKYRTITISEEQHTIMHNLLTDFVESLEKSAEMFNKDSTLLRKYRTTISAMYQEKATKAQAIADILQNAEVIWLNKTDL